MPADAYLIDSNSNIQDTAAQLIHVLALSKTAPRRFRRDYLDSFDWRLFSKGYYLQAEHHDDAILLQLRRLNDLSLVTQLHSTTLPRFTGDLGPGKLATVLRPILEMRALLPQLTTEVRQQGLQLRDAADKITGEVCIEAIESARQSLKLVLHIPVKGYDKDNQTIHRHLQRDVAFQPIDDAPLQLLLRARNIDTAYHSKPRHSLNGQARSDDQIKGLLAFFLDLMQHNQAGIVADIDSEFLHDYRIAVRRSRTLLSQLPGIMPQRTVQRAQINLARLGRITTPLRDLDVMLLNFDDYRALLPDHLRADLDPALAVIRQQRHGAYKRVKQHLRSKSHGDFCTRWRRFLQTPGPAHTPLTNAQRLLRELVDERIWKNYKKVLKQGKAIGDLSPPEDLHELRKRCKKLRYLIEFFRELYPKREIKQLIAVFKQLQDNLGEYQDAHVHLDFFKELRHTMQQQKHLPPATALALDKINAALATQQDVCRQSFQECFDQFSSAPHQKRFKAMFRS